MVERILNDNREEYEDFLLLITFCSLLTFKKIKKLERYKAKIKERLYIL
ncbi:hypothetical protein [Alkalicoccobacillus plakortidis]|uniref:Uncharacterized protein n=1 Tax=Alkalicoccobacillus plakortidis TaxID=444060 RepID=A0ABT0XP25_9BACI|nr:hypothetical protein [Alkalicoccobacillus plakortidis]MCM2677616.1 hypothetical protein [Alkalicoccobacillus plakortidis]